MPHAAQRHVPQGQPARPDESRWPSRQADYRAWYALPAWKALRVAVVKRDKALCQECKRRGQLTPLMLDCPRGREHQQAHVDHIRAHRGDPALFWAAANLQTLCPACHSRKTISEQQPSARPRALCPPADTADRAGAPPPRPATTPSHIGRGGAPFSPIDP